jgi:hypothetical protein
MKHFINFEPHGEPGVTYSIDPAYICALRETETRDDNNYVYINTLNAGIAVTRAQMLRIKRQLLELNHPTSHTQTHEEQKAPETGTTETQATHFDDPEHT